MLNALQVFFFFFFRNESERSGEYRTLCHFINNLFGKKKYFLYLIAFMMPVGLPINAIFRTGLHWFVYRLKHFAHSRVPIRSLAV